MLKPLEKNNIKPWIPEEQLLIYSEKVVNKYVFSGLIPKRESEDVKMSIIEKFLLKQETIAKGYSGKAKISTYCYAVISKMCLEEIRKQKKQWEQTLENSIETGSTNILSSSENLVIKDEIALLCKILLMLGDEKAKAKLFIACSYQLQINELDIYQYDKNYLTNNLKNLFYAKNELKKGDIYKNLTKAVNIVEKKNLKPDAVRMWLNKIKTSIINRLNGSFTRATYTHETFQTLFEYYYFGKN